MSIRLYQRPGSRLYYLRGTVRGIRVYETTGTERRDVAEAIRAKREAALLEESVFGKRAVVSFQRAALSYVEFEERSDRTEADVQRLVDYFGAVLLSSIDQAAADRAVSELLDVDAAPATKRRAVYAPLTAILNHAHARGWCDAPGFDQPKLPRGKTRWLTPAEALSLIGTAAPHLRPLLRFILCTGARMSEALDLDWGDVDLSACKAVFRDTKNGSDRAAALTPEAVLALANLPAVDEDEAGAKVCRGKVFRRDDGKPYADAERQYGGQIKTAWRTACSRAGLGMWVEGNGKPIFEPNLTPHDLRHTWASWFYALTRDTLLLKAEGGWQSAAMVERYAHLMPSALVLEIANVWGASHPRVGTLPLPAAQQARTA